MQPGETPDSIARQMSRASGLPQSQLRTLLGENNGGRLQPGSLLYAGTDSLGSFQPLWLSEKHKLERTCLVLPPTVREVYWSAPRSVELAAQLAEDARQSRAATGTAAAIAAGNLLANTADASIAVWSHRIQGALEAARRIEADALKTFGPRAFDAVRSSRVQLQRMNAYLTSHPAYRQLRNALAQLPPVLQSRLGAIAPIAGRESAWFRRQFAIPLRGGYERAMRVASALQRSAVAAHRLGKATGVLIPIIFAVPEMVWAPDHRTRGKIALRTAVAIPLGSLATNVAIQTGVRIAAVFVLGPTGAFILVAALALTAAWIAVEGTDFATELAYDYALPPNRRAIPEPPRWSGALR